MKPGNRVPEEPSSLVMIPLTVPQTVVPSYRSKPKDQRSCWGDENA
jgi:hypothetical protein